MVALKLFFVYLFINKRGVSESIPWLVNNGKGKEAEKIMRKAAKTNKIVLPEGIFEDDVVGTELEPIAKGFDVQKETNADFKPGLKHKAGSTDKEGSHKLSSSYINDDDNDGDDDDDDDRKAQPSIPHYSVIDIFRSKFIRRYTLVFFAVW